MGIRERDVKPHSVSVSQVVIEKSQPDEERKKRASGSLLFEARGKKLRALHVDTHTDVCATKCSCWELDFLFHHLLTGRCVHMEIYPNEVPWLTTFAESQSSENFRLLLCCGRC